MAKIKVVQMTVDSTEEHADWQYLDDKGRVWRKGYRLVTRPGDADPSREYYWEQVEMPDEPGEELN